MTTNGLRYLLAVSLLAFCTVAVKSQEAIPVTGCKLLKNANRYNGKIVITKGRYTAGFERSDLTFGCPGFIRIEVSVNPADRSRYGFLTEASTLEAMSQLPRGEHPGDNLTARRLRYALVTVVGLFRCHYDFSHCNGASPNHNSLVVKSMQFDTPISETPPASKPVGSAQPRDR